MIRYPLLGETLWLTPQRAAFWESRKALLVSDCHLGKTGHFRKEGIAVPPEVYKEDLTRLVHLLQYFSAGRLIVVGDLFHSRDNKELDLFRKWREDLSHIHIDLVKGNHDILGEEWYRNCGITLHEGTMHDGPLAFTHFPPGDGGTEPRRPARGSAAPQPGPAYLLTGHLHPSVTLRGAGKQSLRFPCFYFGRTHAILPAFGRFTGTARVDARAGDKVFAIVGQEVMEV